ncbi:MAG: hypothetical protein DI537_18895 [Stutzerimonas stutzeri]|nr:MAG: hypothetical protein DI537_18895 [Stutzerimonas stutzeri]
MRAASIAALAPVVATACTLALAQTAQGADYLRGSQIEQPVEPPIFSSGGVDWSGFYFGGLAGYSNVNFDPSQGPGNLIANHLRQTTIETEMGVSRLLNIQSRSTSKSTFGGFAGYNFLFGDVILGIEADYTRLDATTSNSDRISRIQVLSDGYRATADVSGTVSARADQIATLRIRAGYTMGQFMPFITGGLAYGTGKVSSSATVRTQYVDADPSDNTPLPTINNATAFLSGGRKNASMLGGVIGGGVDAVFGGLLLRAEVLYARMEAQGNVTVEHTSARVGAGIKF